MTVTVIHKNEVFDQLTAKQRVVLPLLLQGMTTEEAGKAAGVNRATISNWRGTNKAFKSCEDRMRRQALEDARLALRALAGKAIKAFEQSLSSENERVKFEAARHLIDRLGLLLPEVGAEAPGEGVDLNRLFAVLGVKGTA